MTTYSAEVNIYNPEAIADAVDEAADAYKAYITEVSADNGIVVAAQGKGTVNGAITSATTGWHLADVLEFIKAGVSRFWIGLKSQGDTTPTVRIGKDTGESKMELDYHSLQLIDREGDVYFHVSDLRGTNGEAVFTDTWTADGSTKDFTFTNWADDTNYDVLIDGVVVTEGVGKYNAAVRINPAPANGAVVSVTYTSTSDIAKAYSIGPRGEGKVGASSMSIGRLNVIEGMHSTAIGRNNTVNAWDSVAIGHWNEIDTSGYGYAIGRNLQVKGSDQLVIGANNAPQGPNLYGRSPLFIIGNGELDTNRSNAFMVDWDGYIYRNNETAHIGSIFTNSASNLRRTGTNIDSLMIGTSVSLPPGTYVITAYWTFNTGTSGATSRNLEVAIGSGTSNAWNFTRTNCYSYGYQRLTTYCIRAITQTTTVYVMGSGSQATNASYLDNAGIQAVKIV